MCSLVKLHLKITIIIIIIMKQRNLVINFLSIRNKINEIEVLLDSIIPDVVIGAESWLNDEILSSFYNTYI